MLIPDRTYLPVGMLLLFYSELSVKTSFLLKFSLIFIKKSIEAPHTIFVIIFHNLILMIYYSEWDIQAISRIAIFQNSFASCSI